MRVETPLFALLISGGMSDPERDECLRYELLRLSSCTHAQLERARTHLYNSWLALQAQRTALERDRRIWFSTSPRPVDPERPFCFVPYRMKRRWRDRDRSADTSGFPVHETIGSSNARKEWFRLLSDVIAEDSVVRIRHRYCDEPAILVREKRFRDLEKRASEHSRPGIGFLELDMRDGVQ